MRRRNFDTGVLEIADGDALWVVSCEPSVFKKLFHDRVKIFGCCTCHVSVQRVTCQSTPNHPSFRALHFPFLCSSSEQLFFVNGVIFLHLGNSYSPFCCLPINDCHVFFFFNNWNSHPEAAALHATAIGVIHTLATAQSDDLLRHGGCLYQRYRPSLWLLSQSMSNRWTVLQRAGAMYIGCSSTSLLKWLCRRDFRESFTHSIRARHLAHVQSYPR